MQPLLLCAPPHAFTAATACCGRHHCRPGYVPPGSKDTIAFHSFVPTENQNQVSFHPFVLHEIPVLIELTLGHLWYRLTDAPPQQNSPPDIVSRVDRPNKETPDPNPPPAKAIELYLTEQVNNVTSGGISSSTEASRLFYTFISHFTTSD